MTTSLPTPRAFAITLAILAACALASCGAEQRVLARVGTHTITSEEFLDVARASRAQYAMMPDSAKRLLLEDMIRRELMLCEAEAQGLAQDSTIRNIRRSAEDDLILGVLSEQLAARNVPVSDAEITTFYEWRKTEHHVEAIHVASSHLTAEVLRGLASGEAFNVLAMRYNVSGAVPSNGDLGFVPGGAVPEPLDTHIRESKIGQVFGPVGVGPNASFFGRVIERRAAEIPPAELVRDQLIEALRQRKHRAQVQRAIDGLRTGRRLRLEPGGAQILFARAAGMPESESFGEPQRPDQQIVLARYMGTRGDTVFTLADATQELQTIAEGPDFSSIPSIERWIETHVLRHILIDEARQRHIHEEPLTSRRIDDRIDGMLLQSIYDSEVSARVMVSDDELREEYLRRSAGTPAPPFELMPIDLREQLRSMAMELKRDQLLERFTDELRRKYPVTIDEAMLRRLQWPLPTMELPQQG